MSSFIMSRRQITPTNKATDLHLKPQHLSTGKKKGKQVAQVMICVKTHCVHNKHDKGSRPRNILKQPIPITDSVFALNNNLTETESPCFLNGGIETAVWPLIDLPQVQPVFALTKTCYPDQDPKSRRPKDNC